MLIETAIAASLGALICLDRVAVQLMISRPVVSAPLIGLALGDVYTGLLTGALLELLWIDRIPIGAYVPPNDTFVAILATGGAILAAPSSDAPPRELIALSILTFAPAGLLGQGMERLLRRWNDGLVLRALEDAGAGDPAGVTRRHLAALGRCFVVSLAFLAAALAGGVWLLKAVYPELPASMLRSLGFAFCMLPLIGVGVALNTVKLRGFLPVVCGIFLLLAIVSEFL